MEALGLNLASLKHCYLSTQHLTSRSWTAT